MDNIENIFISYVKPKQQGPKQQGDENPNDFFDVVIQKFCENHWKKGPLKKTFEEIFNLVSEEMPQGCVGIVKSSNFSFDLRFWKNKKEGIFLFVCDSFFSM